MSRWEVVDDGRRPDKDRLVAECADMVLKHASEECDDLRMGRVELAKQLNKLSTATLYCLVYRPNAL